MRAIRYCINLFTRTRIITGLYFIIFLRILHEYLRIKNPVTAKLG